MGAPTHLVDVLLHLGGVEYLHAHRFLVERPWLVG
jgi:hypothetical protein